MAVRIFDNSEDWDFVARVILLADRAHVRDQALGQLKLVVKRVASPDFFDRASLDLGVKRICEALRVRGMAEQLFQQQEFSDRSRAETQPPPARDELPTISPEEEADAVVSAVLASEAEASAELQLRDRLREVKLRLVRMRRGIAGMGGCGDAVSESVRVLTEHLDFVDERLTRAVVLAPAIRFFDPEGTRAYVERVHKDIQALEAIAAVSHMRALDEFHDMLTPTLRKAAGEVSAESRERLGRISSRLSGGVLGLGLATFQALLMEAYVLAHGAIDPYPRAPRCPVMDAKISDAIREAIGRGLSIDGMLGGEGMVEIPGVKFLREHVMRRIAQLEWMENAPVDHDYAMAFAAWVPGDLAKAHSIAVTPDRTTSLQSQFLRVGDDLHDIADEEKRREYAESFNQLGRDLGRALREQRFGEARFAVMRAYVMISAAVWPYADPGGSSFPDRGSAPGIAGVGGSLPAPGGRFGASAVGALRVYPNAHASIPADYLIPAVYSAQHAAMGAMFCAAAVPFPVL